MIPNIIPDYIPPTQLEQDISFILSQGNKQNKALEEPFIKRLLFNRENNSKVEQGLYNWIYENWLWCKLEVKYDSNAIYNTKLIGYRMIDKSKTLCILNS